MACHKKNLLAALCSDSGKEKSTAHLRVTEWLVIDNWLIGDERLSEEHHNKIFRDRFAGVVVEVKHVALQEY